MSYLCNVESLLVFLVECEDTRHKFRKLFFKFLFGHDVCHWTQGFDHYQT